MSRDGAGGDLAAPGKAQTRCGCWGETRAGNVAVTFLQLIFQIITILEMIFNWDHIG